MEFQGKAEPSVPATLDCACQLASLFWVRNNAEIDVGMSP